MQWNTAGLRSWINFNLHHHGTGFAWQPDGYICYDLRPSVLDLCQYIAPWAYSQRWCFETFYYELQSKKTCCTYLPSSGPERTVFDDTLPCFSLSPPDVVVTSDGTEFFIVTAYAFCFGGFFGVSSFCHLLCHGHCSSPWNHVSAAVTSCFGEGSVPSWLQPLNDRQLGND